MNKNKSIVDFKRNLLGLVICTLLVTTSLTVAVGAPTKTSASESPLISTRVSDTPTQLRYSFLNEKPTVTETQLYNVAYTKVTMPGTLVTGMSAGAPALPVQIIQLLIPPKKQIAGINVAGEPIECQLNGINLHQKPVIPYQNPVHFGSALPRTIQVDTTLYNSYLPYPPELKGNYQVGYCRGYTIVSVPLYPVRYLPSEGKLYYYPELTLTIDLTDSNENNPFYRADADDTAWVKSLVGNPEIADSYNDIPAPTTLLSYPGGLCDPSQHIDYVVITTTVGGLNHWTTSPTLPYNWTSLLTRHQQEDGLNGTVVTVQSIYAQPAYWKTDALFNDSAAKIREFCKDAYQDWGTQYVLLAGDAVTVPPRDMDYSYENDVDSDIYFSNLDNTFNANHNSLWGEEGDLGFDLYSELCVGRITCDTPQDVSNWMKKSFYYADATTNTYLDNAAFYGGALGWNAQGDDFIDYAAIKGTNNWLGPSPGAHGAYPSWLGFQYGFETWNIKHPGSAYNMSVKWTAEPPNPGWQGGSESAAITGLRTAINNNKVTLISAVAHADATMSLDVGQTDWANLYTNTMPFFIHDFGCHCGDFDASDHGVLYTMLFHSDTELAFACIYNTCYGWGSFDDTNSSSALQMKLFWDYFFDLTNNSGNIQNWQLGKAQAWSKDAMAPTIGWTYNDAPGSWRGIIQGCLLFGDPAQRLKAPIPQNHDVAVTNVDTPANAVKGEPTQITATITNCGINNETNIIVDFNVDGAMQQTTTIPSLAAGQNTMIPFWWTPNAVGNHIVGCYAHPVPGETFLFNNILNKTVQVITRTNDVGVLTINYPLETISSGNCTVNASVRNFGDQNQNAVVVNCSIYTGYNYTERFDTSNGGYTQTGSVWQWGVPTSGPGSAHSGTKLWATILNGNYPSNANAMLDSISLTLPPIPTTFSFWHWYNTESYWDGGNVKITQNNGVTWTLLGSYQNPYPEDAIYSGTPGVGGQPGFSGSSNGWQKITFDLTPYAGKTVKIRWHFGSDTNTVAAGWYVDDVIIKSSGAMLDTNPTYNAQTAVTIPSHSTRFVEFSPPWQATAGTYFIVVKTQLSGDENTANDQQGKVFTVLPNSPPNTPALASGPVKGILGSPYTYNTQTTDPNGDDVAYFFDWGDGTNSGWTSFVSSGSQGSASHSWTTQGIYAIKVKAKDIHDAESSWSTSLQVRIYKLGDINGDDNVNFGDINPFVLAVTAGETEYYLVYPDGYYYTADINQDGVVNFGDINPFVALLSGG